MLRRTMIRRHRYRGIQGQAADQPSHPRAMRSLPALLLGGCVATLLGCSSTAPPPAARSVASPQSPAAPHGPASSGSIAARQGRLAWPRWRGRCSPCCDPMSRVLRVTVDTRRQIDAAWLTPAPRGPAQRRGDLDAASQPHLSVLALQPEHATAADALRAVERERVASATKSS
jgi:hypothetical protein